jgi:hypothetical protein
MSAATVTLTALQARRCWQLARWMTRHGGTPRTRRLCRHLADSLADALDAGRAEAREKRLENRRKNWRNGTRAHRERKQQGRVAS